jgi:hypothetical protein
VAFGDVNLSEEQVRGKYAGSPGGGGWPTIRVYNKATGYDGAFAGDWKDKNGLSGAMCDVFGKDETMQKYVEELGSTSLCKASDGAGCSDKEKEFIAKWEGKDGVDAQLARLRGMTDNKMTPELKKWLNQRIAILKQLGAPKEEL